MVSVTDEQNIIYSKTHLDAITHVQTIICSRAVIGRSRGGLSANENEFKKCMKDMFSFQPINQYFPGFELDA